MSHESEFARLILRGVLGSTMIAHGLKHARSLPGTAGWFESIGFRQPDLQAKTSAVVEIGAGAALLAGAATPYAASAVVGTMAVAARTVHIENGYFITSEGYEYVLALAGASAAIAALGPGTLSIDRILRRHLKLTGAKGGLFALVLGVAGAALQLRTFWSKPPAKS